MSITVTKSRLALILVIFFTVLVAAAAVGTALLLQNNGVGGKKNYAAVGQTPAPPPGYCNPYTGAFGGSIAHCTSIQQWCGGTTVNGQCDGTGTNNKCTNQGFCSACEAGWTLDGNGACQAQVGGATDPNWAAHPGMTCATRSGGFPCAPSRFNNAVSPGSGQEQTCDARGTQPDSNGWYYAVAGVESLDLTNESNPNNCGATCSDHVPGYVGNAPACSNQYRCPGTQTGNGKICTYCHPAPTGSSATCGADNPNAVVYPDANGNYPACPSGPIGQPGYIDDSSGTGNNKCVSAANGGSDNAICHYSGPTTPVASSTPITTTPAVPTYQFQVNAFCDSNQTVVDGVTYSYHSQDNQTNLPTTNATTPFSKSGLHEGSVNIDCPLYKDPNTGASHVGSGSGTTSVGPGNTAPTISCHYTGCSATPPPSVTPTPPPPPPSGTPTPKKCTGLQIPNANGQMMPVVTIDNSSAYKYIYSNNPAQSFSSSSSFTGVNPTFAGAVQNYDLYYASYIGDGPGKVNTPSWTFFQTQAVGNKFDPTIPMSPATGVYNPNTYGYAYIFVPQGDQPPAAPTNLQDVSSSACYTWVYVQRPICQNIALTKNGQDVKNGNVNAGDSLTVGPLQWSSSPIPNYVWEYKITDLAGNDSGWKELGQYNQPTVPSNIPDGIKKAGYTIATYDNQGNRYILYPSYNNGCYAEVNITPTTTTTPPPTTTIPPQTTTQPPVTSTNPLPIICQSVSVSRNGTGINSSKTLNEGDNLSITVSGSSGSTNSGFDISNPGATDPAEQSGGDPYTGSYTVPTNATAVSVDGFTIQNGVKLHSNSCRIAFNVAVVPPVCNSLAVTNNGTALHNNDTVNQGDTLSIVVTGNSKATGTSYTVGVAGGQGANGNGANPGTYPYTVIAASNGINIVGFATANSQKYTSAACSLNLNVHQPQPILQIDKVAIAKNSTSITGSVAPDNRCVGVQPGCVSQNLAVNDTVTYRLVVRDTGDAPLQNVNVLDNLTTNPTFNSAIVQFANPNSANTALRKCSSGSYNSTTGVCSAYDVTSYAVTSTFPKDNTSATPHVTWTTIPTLNPGEVYEAELIITVLQGGNYVIKNSMYVTTTTVGICNPPQGGGVSTQPGCSDNINHPIGTVPPTISKTSFGASNSTNTQSFNSGDTVTYSVTVNNTGSSTAYNGLTVVDQPLTAFDQYFDTSTFIPVNPSSGATAATLSSDKTTVSWTGINVAGSSSVTLQFSMKLKSGLTATAAQSCTLNIPNNATVTAGLSGTPPTTTYAINVKVPDNYCHPSLTILKTASPTSVSSGGTFNISIKVSNTSNVDALVQEVTDHMPPTFTYTQNLSLINPDGSQGTVTETTSGNDLIFTLNGSSGTTLHANQFITINLTMAAPNVNICEVFPNTAQITNPAGGSSQTSLGLNCVPPVVSTVPPTKVLPNTGVFDNMIITVVIGMGIVAISYFTYRFDLIYKVESMINNKKIKSRKK